MGLETELKLRIPASRDGIDVSQWLGRHDTGRSSRRHLVSTYFDTPRQKLRRHGLSLRIRHDGVDFRPIRRDRACRALPP